MKPYDGAYLIAQERDRHVWDEGWTAEHDDQHPHGEMAMAGTCYARHAATCPYIDNIKAYRSAPPPPDWPWGPEWWKPKQPQRDLIRAGALMAAEFDRIDRRIIRDGAKILAPEGTKDDDALRRDD